ncbi:MAG: ABC transporter ATP-binding protein [Betaproteobacteria bacterium]|nr:ABC transporter ATP-binding protein [Betaproteobacteria bacterium]
MHRPLLEAVRIGKRFGGLRALNDVSLALEEGSITGLIGPNGAGKTTFFNVLTGIYKPDSGAVRFAGEPLPAGRPHAVAARGIARTFQNIRLFSNMTVLENVMVGRHVRTRAGVLGAIFRTSETRQEEAAITASACKLLDYVGIAAQAQRFAGTLSYGDQRRLEIARALATEPKLLALDEPAAGMNATERMQLANLVRRIREDGTAILLIEHDVKWVSQLCDHITVLDYGECIAEGTPREVLTHSKVIEAYLGRGVA